jgi:hypothetical protein
MTRYWCQLKEIADVHLGYKSLQNEFFYLSAETIGQFKIEKEYLRNVYLLSDFDSQKYLQSPKQSIWLFQCRHSESDLRGTGALRYIRTMAKRPAKVKKQSGKHQTIQEALEEQSGGFWYAPKAIPHSAHIWLRKAFAGIFAPFLFKNLVTVDQRCNSLTPKENVQWDELAALMTTTLFALALEGDGACSMGGGALEWKTKSLRNARIIDPRLFSDNERSRIVTLARTVWQTTKPVDLSKRILSDKSTFALDNYVMSLIGRPVSIEDLYLDLHSTVKTRIEKAKARKTSSKVREVANVQEVARAIATVVEPFVETHRFPEDFCSANGRQQVVEVPSGDLTLIAERFLSHGHLKVEEDGGRISLEVTNTANVVEVIARALLLGRRRFSIPAEDSAISAALDRLFPWLISLQKEIEQGVNTSALGTRFEHELRIATLRELGIATSAFASEIWGTHNLRARPRNRER